MGGRCGRATVGLMRAARTAPESESERFEIYELGPRGGRAHPRLLATAGSLSAVWLAVRTLRKEAGDDSAALAIRDTRSRRWLS